MTSKSRRRSLQGAVFGASQPRQDFDGLGLGSQPKLLKTLTSSVTTAWVSIGTRSTSPATSCRTSSTRTAVGSPRYGSTPAHRTSSSARATPFNLERLFYLGSEKDECDVGQYGEGFKVAATCLLRDHGVTPIAQCGTDLLLLRIADAAVQGTALYPVQYDFYHTAEAFEGTRLILRGSSKKLARACQDGLTHFFYEGNPLIGMNCWATGNALAIYDSKDGQGHLFYRNLKRGEIEGIPLVLAINKPTKTIENMIGRDRDRNAFGEPVLTLAYRQVAGALKWSHEAQRVVVESARGVWERGHPLLAAIADKIRGYHWQNPHWPQKLSGEVFGDRYYARSTSTTPTEQLEFSKIEQQWKEQGRKALPSYFGSFGVIDARSHVEQLKKKADEESRRRGERSPTEAEWIGIRSLSKITRDSPPRSWPSSTGGRSATTSVPVMCSSAN